MFDLFVQVTILTGQVDDYVRNSVSIARLHVDLIHNDTAGVPSLYHIGALKSGSAKGKGNTTAGGEGNPIAGDVEIEGGSSGAAVSGDSKPPATPTAFQPTTMATNSIPKADTRRRNSHPRLRVLSALSPTDFAIVCYKFDDFVERLVYLFPC